MNFELRLAVIAIVVFASALYLQGQATQLQPINTTESGISVSANGIAAQVKEDCKDGARQKAISKETCYSLKLENISLENGHDYAFQVLFALQKQDVDAFGCHFMAHGIGHGAYKRNPQDAQHLITSINPTCGYGAPMGIIELYAAGKLTDREVLRSVCPEDKTPGDCNHIIGHILLVETHNNIEPALELCSAFTNQNRRQNCMNGVFMENIIGLNLIAHGYANETQMKNWAARLDSLEKLCRSHKGDNATACWRELPHAAIAKFGHNATRVFDFCNSAQEGAWLCKLHAIDILNAQKNFKAASLKGMCEIKQPEPNFEQTCYLQLVESELVMDFPDKSGTISFCASLGKEFQKDCFQKIGTTLRWRKASENEIRELCSNAPDEYIAACVGSTSSSATIEITGPDR